MKALDKPSPSQLLQNMIQCSLKTSRSTCKMIQVAQEFHYLLRHIIKMLTKKGFILHHKDINFINTKYVHVHRGGHGVKARQNILAENLLANKLF